MQKIKQLLAPPAFENEEKTRNAAILNAILIALMLISFALVVGLSTARYTDPSSLPVGSFITVISIAGLIFLRRGYVMQTSIFLVVLLWLAVSYLIYTSGGIQDVVTMVYILPIILATLLLNIRSGFIVTALTIFAGLGFYLAEINALLPPYVQEDTLNVWQVLVAASLMVFILVALSSWLFQNAAARIQQSNQELADLSHSLAIQTKAQALDLALTAKIGGALARFNDLDLLLNESIEMIRDRFDLYYVQIYLVDKSLNNLVLRAGTGPIGQELVRRGHQLPLTTNSINGMAAINKRSVIVMDTSKEGMFRANPLLPYTRSEMSVPLQVSEKLVGVINLQDKQVQTFTEDKLPVFEALASQLAVAIENAKLLVQAESARLETEAYSRRIVRTGWDEHLDALSRPERLGFEFMADQVVQLDDSATLTEAESEGSLSIPITFLEEPIGFIEVEREADLTAEDMVFLHTVAQRIGQQADNLRLLESATQYRLEAERVLRRLTHEGWQTYEESPTLAEGFIYDQEMVRPVTAVSPTADTPDMLHHDLSLHGETIGELIVTKSEQMDEIFADELVTAVADQLVAHMEKLRLSEQTEKALAQSQRRSRELGILNAVAEATSDINNIDEFLKTVQQQLSQVVPMNSFTVATYNKTDNTIYFEYAFDEKSGRHENTPPIQLQPFHLSHKSITQASPQIIHFTAAEVAEQKLNRPPNMMSEDATVTASLLFIPLISGHDVVGVLSTQSYQLNTYTQEHVDLLIGVAGYVTTAIQKIRLFEQTQARATELAVINEVAQTVAQQIDRQELLKSVQMQVQRVLQVDAFFIGLYDRETGFLEYPYIYDEGEVYQTPPRLPTPNTNIHQVLQSGEFVLINRTQQEIDALVNKKQETRLGKEERISASLLYIPLRTGQEISGVLSIQSYQLNAYSAADVSLLSSIANHVAVALDNSRLLTESRQTAEREQVLRGIAATINTSIDAESVLQTAAREIGRALGLETYVYLTPDLGVIQSTVKTPVDSKQNGHGTAS
ncbi:MAG: GAF domain-containing protein [Chloroflexota bacterium]